MLGFTYLALLMRLFASCSAQQIASNNIVFTTAPGWIDMRKCATCPLYLDADVCGVGDFIPDRVGCKTNACLCRASTQGEAVLEYGEIVLRLCSNYDDQKTATNFLMAYCSRKGYPSVESAVALTTAITRSSTAQTTPRSNTLQTSFIPSPSASTSPPITAPPGFPSATPSSSDGLVESAGKGLRTAEIIGITLASLGFIVASITLYYNRRSIKVMLRIGV